MTLVLDRPVNVSRGEVITKTALYNLHVRAWARIPFGRQDGVPERPGRRLRRWLARGRSKAVF